MPSLKDLLEGAVHITNPLSLFGGGGDNVPPPPAETAKKGKAKGTAAPATTEQPFDLGAALQDALGPQMSQLVALLGGGQGTTPQPGSPLATYLAQPQGNGNLAGLVAAAAPSLGDYLKNLPPQLAATVAQGIGGEVGSLAQMPGAVGAETAGAGQAGLLQDLLNAARYQAIYRQSLYGQPPPGTSPLGQLYQQVVAGGNALAGGLGAVSPTGSPTAPTPAAPGGQKATLPNLSG